MNELEATMQTPIIKNSTGSTVLNVGHLVVAGLGALALYFAVPERKRKNLFK